MNSLRYSVLFLFGVETSQVLLWLILITTLSEMLWLLATRQTAWLGKFLLLRLVWKVNFSWHRGTRKWGEDQATVASHHCKKAWACWIQLVYILPVHSLRSACFNAFTLSSSCAWPPAVPRPIKYIHCFGWCGVLDAGEENWLVDFLSAELSSEPCHGMPRRHLLAGVFRIP